MHNRKSSFESAAAKLLVFFLENPDEELGTPDVGVKFGIAPNGLTSSLQGGVDLGLFGRTVGGPGRRVTYMAGPRLLQALRAGPERARGGTFTSAAAAMDLLQRAWWGPAMAHGPASARTDPKA